MPEPIDWLYRRKSCVTCRRADGHIAAGGTVVKEMVDATKTRLGPAAALGLLAGIDRVVAMKGKKVVVFDLGAARPDDETLLAHLIGTTGNLRAPTARVGRTLLVGFNAEAYREVLGV